MDLLGYDLLKSLSKFLLFIESSCISREEALGPDGWLDMWTLCGEKRGRKEIPTSG